MNYELAKKLKDAGFLQKPESYPFVYDKNGTLAHMISDRDWNMQDMDIKIPTLSELIEACGDDFCGLVLEFKDWFASGGQCQEGLLGEMGMRKYHETGKTPEEAVANLWLEINKKL